MAALVGALRAMLSLDSTAFVSGAERARKSSTRLESRLESLATAARRIGAGMAVAAGALAVAVRSQLNAADQMGEAAEKFGVGVEELSRLSYAAKIYGVETNTLGVSLQQLSKRMDAAAKGGKTQAAMFAELGVAVTDSEGQLRTTEAVMQDLADVFARMPDGAEKTALAMRLFGRSGADMILMLNQGKSGMQAMAAEADRLGITISQETADAAGKFNENIDRLRGAMGGLVMQIAAALAPSLEKLSEWAIQVANAFGQLTPETRAMIVQVGAIVGVVGLAAGAFALLSAAISPVTVAIGAVAAGAMLIYENWEGIAAWFSEQWATIKTATVETWEAIKAAIGGAIEYVTGLWDTFMGKITAAIETAKQAGQAIAEAMKFDPGSATNQFQEDFGMPDPGASYGAGADAADGLVDGFKDQVVKRQGEIDEVANQITERVRNRWQIQSPSRVFREIGQFLSEGLGLGIRDGQPQVESAMDTVGDAIDGKADSLTSKLDAFKSSAQNAFVGLVTGAMTFKQAIGQVASQLAQMAAQAAFQQLFGGMFKPGGFLGGLFGGLFANGAAFANGRVTAFASGGVVTGATAFAMQGGMGVMGEAGPEAIMPLARGRGGKLGVVAEGGNVQRVQLEILEGAMFASRVEVIADQRAVQVTRTYDRNVAPATRTRNQRERG